MIALLIGALFLAACGGGQPAQQPPAQPPAAQQPAAPAPSADGQKVRVEMSEFKFDMQPAEVKAGAVSFELVNVGTVEHSFIIDGTSVKSEQIRAGQTVTVQADLTPGTYTAVCDVAGHKEAGMTMQLVVK
jgi:nitrite reductase (NO-forming)